MEVARKAGSLVPSVMESDILGRKGGAGTDDAAFDLENIGMVDDFQMDLGGGDFEMGAGNLDLEEGG
jgi:hypothetical protein